MGLTCFKSWKQDRARLKGGNRDVLASPGSYYFLSCGQREEWLKTINTEVWIPFTGVFGQRLEETVLYERRYGQHQAPLVVEQCVDFIRQMGLHEVGLFCQPGQASMVKELQQAFNAGEKPAFDSSTDVHTVASLLKLYLCELPEPVVPFSRYHDFLLCGRKLSLQRTQGLAELRAVLHDLPVANFNLLHYICRFLYEVQSCSNSNEMSAQNLAAVFGPNILRPKADDPLSIITGATVVQQLMSELIREHQSLFSTTHLGGTHLLPSAPQQASACARHLSLPLISECRSTGSFSSPRDIGLAPPRQPSSSSQIQLTAGGRSPFSQQRLLGHRHTSSHPEPGLFPVPSIHSQQVHLDYHHLTQETSLGLGPAAVYPLIASESKDTLRAERCLSGSRPKSGPRDWAETGKDLAQWDGGLGMRTGKEATTEEGVTFGSASRGSSEAQGSTLSMYDNLDHGASLQRMEEVSGTATIGQEEQEVMEPEEAGSTSVIDSSSWSSCEVLPLDENSSQIDAGSGASPMAFPQRHGSAHFYSFRTDLGENDEGDNHNRHATSQASSCAPTDCPLSTGSSEVFLPSGSPYPNGDQLQPQQVHSLLDRLREQMAKQENEFQARIHRLMECNVALEGQVAELQASLTQQRRWHSVAEMKLRKVERARAQADRQNVALQRDMDQFYQSFSQEERTSQRNIQSF